MSHNPFLPGSWARAATGRTRRRRALLLTPPVIGTIVLLVSTALLASLGLLAGSLPAIFDAADEPPDAGGPHVFGGLGAWVDVYDYARPYQGEAEPAVTPRDVPQMAANGVRTLYLQTSGTPGREGQLLADRPLAERFVEAAHRHGMRVVGWYAPQLAHPEDDVARILAALDLGDASGGLDGFALDIEVRAVEDPELRGALLVALTERVRDAVGPLPLGAIVLPPVLLSEINPDLWPRFPWSALAPLYDAWLPMAYWTVRSADSPYADPARYLDANVRRLRHLLADEDAPVHALGGIGDEVTPRAAEKFAAAARAVGALGASFYDHATTPPEVMAVLDRALGRPAASSPGPS
jgi:hypothetical protein